MNAYIFAAAPITDYSFLDAYDFSDALIICADAGIAHANRLGIRPQLMVGDFDSALSVPEGIPLVRHPAEKDDTDTMLAVKLALARGADTITIFGGTGGRIDHTYANLQSAHYAVRRGVKATVASEDCTLTIIRNGEAAFSREDWRYISLFAFGGRCEGVSISPAKYPLEKATLTTDFPLGVSNEFLSERVYVSVEKGSLLIMLTKE